MPAIWALTIWLKKQCRNLVKQINFSGSYATDGKIMKNNVNHVLSDCNWKDEDSDT